MWDDLQLLLVWAPVVNIQLILEGVFIGAIFALSAYGLALVWGVMNIKNLAQGDFVILGGYLAFAMNMYNIPLLIILPIIMIIMFVYGWVIYLLMIKRILDQDMFVSLLATFGLSLVMQQVINLFFGPEVQTIDMQLPVFEAFDSMVTVPSSKLLALGLAGIIAFCVVLFMKRSRMGQSIRATAQDPRAARVLGINTDRVYAFTFAFNSALCGAAGVLVSIIFVIQPFYGITYSMGSFAIVTAAGLGNLPGVIVSAFGIGLFTKYCGFFESALEYAAPVGVLLSVLMWRQITMRRNRQVVR
ncbi:branched-chain amino acid ABC transporter permease [Alphaproteobacteria bacterium LSUCC0684]